MKESKNFKIGQQVVLSTRHFSCIMQDRYGVGTVISRYTDKVHDGLPRIYVWFPCRRAEPVAFLEKHLAKVTDE